MDEKAKEELRQIANELKSLRKEIVNSHHLFTICNKKMHELYIRIQFIKDKDGKYLILEEDAKA